jgi:hypothetical protein
MSEMKEYLRTLLDKEVEITIDGSRVTGRVMPFTSQNFVDLDPSSPSSFSNAESIRVLISGISVVKVLKPVQYKTGKESPEACEVQ